jgi:hypothetical protein
MPLTFTHPPADLTAQVKEHIFRVNPGLRYPHAIFTLDVQDAQRGRIPSFAGWRHYLGEMAIDVIGGEIIVLRGAVAQESLAALERLIVAYGSQEYAVRSLQAPALYFNGIWLHGDDDWVLPLKPTYDRYEQMVYKYDVIAGILQEIAEKEGMYSF